MVVPFIRSRMRTRQPKAEVSDPNAEASRHEAGKVIAQVAAGLAIGSGEFGTEEDSLEVPLEAMDLAQVRKAIEDTELVVRNAQLRLGDLYAHMHKLSD